MNQNRKHFLSFGAIIVFAYIAVSSAGALPFFVNFNVANLSSSTDSLADNRNYLLKNDGTKIYGTKVYWDDNYKDKTEIVLDDKAYPISEIFGFRMSSEKYYWKEGKSFYKKILDGKISIYYGLVVQSHTTATNTTSTPLGNGRTLDRTTGGQTRSYTVPIYFYKWQDDHNLIRLDTHEKLQWLVKDCPKAFEKVNMKSKKLAKLIRQNPNYLNDVIILYNNCN